MLVQQGVQKIEVIVRKGGAVGATSVQGAKENTAGEKAGDKTTASGSDGNHTQKRIVKSTVLHAFTTAKSTGDQLLDFYEAGLGMQYGDQAYQDRVQRITEQYRDVSNTAISVAMGARMGSWGGPVFAAIGGIMGGLTSISSIAFRQARRERDFDYKVFKENSSVEYARARANINLTTGRLR